MSKDLQRVVWRSGKMEVDCAECNSLVILGVDNLFASFRLTIDYPKEVMRFQWQRAIGK